MFTRKHPGSEENASVSLLGRRSVKIALMVLILGVAFLGVPAIANAADPSGADTLAADPTAPVNMVWTLISAFLVFFMQLGFGFLGAGLIRKKNNVNYWTKSFMDFCIASLGFWAFGFAIMFGGSAAFPGQGKCFPGIFGIFPVRGELRCFYDYVLAFPDGLCRYCLHHSSRCSSRKNEDNGLPCLQLYNRRYYLPDLRSLDMGKWMAEQYYYRRRHGCC